MVIFTARQNLANLNEVKMNLIVKFANLAGKSYIIMRKRCSIQQGEKRYLLIRAKS